MMNRKDVNGFCRHLVDDAVVSVQKLAERRVGKLRDDATRLRELPQQLDGANDPGGEISCVDIRVAGDERADRVQVLDGLCY